MRLSQSQHLWTLTLDIKQMKSLDTKRRLLQNANDLRAFKLHERRIARLYTQSQNLDRSRRLNDQNQDRERW